MLAQDYGQLREMNDDERLTQEQKDQRAGKIVSQSLNNTSIYLNLASQVLIELSNFILSKNTAKFAEILIMEFSKNLPMIVHHADRLLKWAGPPIFKQAKRAWQGFMMSVDNFWSYTGKVNLKICQHLTEFRIAFQKLWQKIENGGHHLKEFAKENPFILIGILSSIGLAAATVVCGTPTLIAAGVTAGVTGVAIAIKTKA